MFSRTTAAVLAATFCGISVHDASAAAPPPHTIPGAEPCSSLRNSDRSRASVAWSARLPPLDWDDGLAGTAQAWADSCVADPSGSGLIAHNPNRGTGYPSTVGENIAGWSVPPSAERRGSRQHALVTLNQTPGPTRAEILNCAANACDGEPYSIHRHWKTCGHYTQIVAAATTRVGCGLRRAALTCRQRSTLVCDFSAAGNTVDADTGVLARP